MKAAKINNQLLTMSCTELARQTKVDKGCWSRYFSGEFKPSFSNLVKISEALHISIDDVIAGIEERKSAKA